MNIMFKAIFGRKGQDDANNNQNKNDSNQSVGHFENMRIIEENEMNDISNNLQVPQINSNSSHSSYISFRRKSTQSSRKTLLVNSVRRTALPPPALRGQQQATLICQDWLISFISSSNTSDIQRKRHYWRLTTEKVNLYSDENTNANPCNGNSFELHDIIKVEEAIDKNSSVNCIKLTMTNQLVYTLLQDTSVSFSKPISVWIKAFRKALAPHLLDSEFGNLPGIHLNHREVIKGGHQNSANLNFEHSGHQN